jgi:hypothetical protein
MNKFLKYLIFIFLGILIYLILNQINLFTIGGKYINDRCDSTNDDCNTGEGDCIVDGNPICICSEEVPGEYRCQRDPDIVGTSISVEPQTQPPPPLPTSSSQGRWQQCTGRICTIGGYEIVQRIDTSCASSGEEQEMVASLSVDFFAVHLDNLSTNCDTPYLDRDRLSNILHTIYKQTNYVVHKFNTEAMREGKMIQMYGGGDQTITEVGVLYVKQDIFDRILREQDI